MIKSKINYHFKIFINLFIELSFNLDMLGFNLLEFELKNISNIYTNSNIDISNIDVDNLIDMDVDEVKNILKNFIYE